MKAVFGDPGLVEVDKLTYDQLADHLPEILDGSVLRSTRRSRTGGAGNRTRRPHAWKGPLATRLSHR
jgi:hypothetical protein